MGKGDKKTKRGKIIMRSFGVRRPRKKSYVPVEDDTKPKNLVTAKEEKVLKEVKHPKDPAEPKEKTVRVKKEPKKEVVDEKAEKVVKPKKEKKV
jgi:30S ribosomal protein S31